MNIKFSSFYLRRVKLLIIIMIIYLFVLIYYQSFVGPKHLANFRVNNNKPNYKLLTSLRSSNQEGTNPIENKENLLTKIIEDQVNIKTIIGFNKTLKTFAHMSRVTIPKVKQMASLSPTLLNANSAKVRTTKITIQPKTNIKNVPANIRKFINTREELELTKIVTMMPFDYECNEYQPISVYILSTANAYERRQTLRDTWVSDVKGSNISVFFAIALTVNQTDQQIIVNENQKYKDLIQFGFIDSYYNLTLKSISILRWSQTFCKTKIVLKADDDIVVNLQLLLKNLDNFHPGIHGVLYNNVIPIQNIENKWYMPKIVYGERFYPNYTGGPAYLISGFKVHELLNGLNSHQGYIMSMEDVFLTGVIAESVGMSRFNSNLIANGNCEQKCIMEKMAIICSCLSSNHMKTRWLEMKNNNLCKIDNKLRGSRTKS